MPELPEVELAARSLRAWGLRREVRSVEVDPRAGRIFRPASPARWGESLPGRRLAKVERRGKHLLLTFTGPRSAPPLGLLSHLGMTGKWLRRASGEPSPAHVRATLLLEDGAALCYRDPRLFGRLRLLPGARFEEVPELASLGPDPLLQGIDPSRLGERLGRRAVPLKPLLLDQALLAGIGNIQASEGLFRARIDPRRKANSLSGAEVKRLAAALLASIGETIAREGEGELTYVEEPGAPNPFLVYGRAGEPCPRCTRVALERAVQAGRSTFFCPRCQR